MSSWPKFPSLSRTSIIIGFACALLAGACTATAKNNTDLQAKAEKELDDARESMIRATTNNPEAQHLLVEATAAFESGDLHSTFTKLAELYEVEGLSYAARNARTNAAKLSGATPRPTSTPRPPPRPAPTTKKVTAAKKIPATSTPKAAATASPKRSDAAKRGRRDQRELGFARKLVSDDERASGSVSARHLESAEKAWDARDLAGMYRSLAELYEVEGLNFAADSARQASAKHSGKTVTRVARAAPGKTPTPSPRTTPTVTPRRTPRPTPSLTPKPKAEPKSTPKPTPKAPTEVKSAKSAPSAPAGTVAYELETARAAYETGRTQTKRSGQLLADATAALGAGDNERVYGLLVTFYQNERMPYAAKQLEPLAGMDSEEPATRVASKRTPQSATPTATRSASATATIPPPRRTPTPAPQPATRTPAPPPRPTVAKAAGATTPTDPAVASRELAWAKRIKVNTSGAPRTGVEHLKAAERHLLALNLHMMYRSLIAFYDGNGFRFSADGARKAAAIAAKTATKTRVSATPTPIAKATPARTATPKAPSRATPAPTKRPAPRATPGRATPGAPRQEDRLALETATRTTKKNAGAGSLLARARGSLEAGDRVGFYRNLTTLYAKSGMRNAARTSSRKAARLAKNPEAKVGPSARPKPQRTPTAVTAKPTPTPKPKPPQNPLVRTLGDGINVLRAWHSAWTSKDLTAYRAQYDPAFRSSGRNLDSWIEHKSTTFEGPGAIDIDLSDLSVTIQHDKATFQFAQTYRSSKLNDLGKKTLSIEKRNASARIATETWRAMQRPPGIPSTIGFPNSETSQLVDRLERILAALAGWERSWEAKALDAYMGHYAADFETDDFSRDEYRAQKSRVFADAGTIEVAIEDLRITIAGEVAKVRFTQTYRSSKIQDRGIKTLTLEAAAGDDYRILEESWRPLN